MSFTDYHRQQRNRWFKDEDGAKATTKREDEKISVVIDWSQSFASGESIEDVVYADSGVTRSSTSNNGSVTTTIVTGLGEFEITVTTDAGHTFQQVRRFYGPTGLPRKMYDP